MVHVLHAVEEDEWRRRQHHCCEAEVQSSAEPGGGGQGESRETAEGVGEGEECQRGGMHDIIHLYRWGRGLSTPVNVRYVLCEEHSRQWYDGTQLSWYFRDTLVMRVHTETVLQLLRRVPVIPAVCDVFRLASLDWGGTDPQGVCRENGCGRVGL